LKPQFIKDIIQIVNRCESYSQTQWISRLKWPTDCNTTCRLSGFLHFLNPIFLESSMLNSRGDGGGLEWFILQCTLVNLR
jgi:hypothetical protein